MHVDDDLAPAELEQKAEWDQFGIVEVVELGVDRATLAPGVVHLARHARDAAGAGALLERMNGDAELGRFGHLFGGGGDDGMGVIAGGSQ